MKEIYVVVGRGAFGRVSILDKETFIKFRQEGSLEGRDVLICSTERSFIVEGDKLKESKYKFQLIP